MTTQNPTITLSDGDYIEIPAGVHLNEQDIAAIARLSPEAIAECERRASDEEAWAEFDRDGTTPFESETYEWRLFAALSVYANVGF